MPFQPRLTDFQEGLFVSGKKVYPWYVVILQRLSRLEPLSEIKCLQGLSSQALHQQLLRLKRLGWVERKDFGVWEPTKQGLEYLESISGTNKLLIPRGGRNRVVAWVSAHHDLTFKFALRSQQFDRKLFCRRKDGKDYWYLRDGVTARIGKTHVFFTIYGCNASSVRGVYAVGLARARWAAGEFQRRSGARVSELGEAVGLPHFVVTDKGLAKWLKNGLNLSKVPKDVADCKFFVDDSHKGLVEFTGNRSAVEAVGDEVAWLLAGGGQKLLEEVQGLRSDLRFKPRGGPRIDVT
jgi:hypothetical protein